MQVFDKQNAPMELGQSLGRGGEAEVFLLKTRDDVVFKYYHSEVLKKRANQLEKKLDLCIALILHDKISTSLATFTRL